MKQKINDLVLRAKKDRRIQIALGLGAIAVLFLVFFDGKAGPKKPKAKKNEKVAALDTELTSRENYQDIIKRFGEDVIDTQKRTASLEKEVIGLRTDMKENTDRVAEIFKKMFERMAENEANSVRGVSNNPVVGSPSSPIDVAQIASQSSMPGSRDMMMPGLVGSASDDLDKFGDLEPASVAPPAPPAPRKLAFVGAGDSVRVELLAGVNAPTDGSPYPVVLKLVSDVYGPDGSSLPLGEARIIAAAQGSLTDSRALFRLTSLNISLPNGQRKVYDIDGWIVGEDGIRGMSGILIDPIGKSIGASFGSGMLQGLGEGLANSQLERVEQSDGTVVERVRGASNRSAIAGGTGLYALGKGVKQGSNEWADIIRQRVDQLVPQVQVLSGRKATAVFARSLKIDGLFDQIAGDEEAYEGLE